MEKRQRRSNPGLIVVKLSPGKEVPRTAIHPIIRALPSRDPQRLPGAPKHTPHPSPPFRFLQLPNHSQESKLRASNSSGAPQQVHKPHGDITHTYPQTPPSPQPKSPVCRNRRKRESKTTDMLSPFPRVLVWFGNPGRVPLRFLYPPGSRTTRHCCPFRGRDRIRTSSLLVSMAWYADHQFVHRMV